MQIEVLKSKIHCAHVTEANLNYMGSITIDEDLMDAANLIAGEKVQMLLDKSAEWTDKIRSVRDELIANFPDSASVSARAIMNAVVEQQKTNK